ncbi:MAG: NAD-glutamate dehydrogenase, partial [Spirochaetes bacterium]|nr:NAD-glutamate dehydrogenase [Spirochaetota bacterium]
RTKKKTHNQFLRLYIVTKPRFSKKKSHTFEDNVNRAFIDQSAPDTIARYKKAWESMEKSESPYIFTSDKQESGETRVMVGIHSESARQFLNYFSHLINNYSIFSNRKYREPFKDGKRVYTFYFNKIEAETVMKFSGNLNAVVMLPENQIAKLFLGEVYSSLETMYAISAAAFTHQFLTVLTEEYLTLNKALKDQPEAKGILDTLKMRLIKDTFSEARIAQTVLEHYDIVSLIYSHFESKMHSKKPRKNLASLEESIIGKIEADVPSVKDRTILKYFLTFNDMILKTNFFMRDKTCMAYRLDPGFLSKVDFPEEPFGLFYFVGREFIGFHVRFRDIARGGIRIIRSRDLTGYEHNLDTIFLENYNLAFTQQAKNKDIPEGGSKGTILLNLNNQNGAKDAFKSYIDGMMDLIMPGGEVLDLYGKEEILFLGPDEGT